MTTRFAIVGVQRTGTTWIRTTLNDHPSILALGEVFLYRHGRFPFYRRAGSDVAHSYRQYIQTSWGRRLGHLVRRRAVVHDYLQRLFSQPDLGAVGFKMMHTQAVAFPAAIDYLLSERIRIIHVVRRNVLKTLISRESARQRHLYHARSRVPVKQITLDVGKLRGNLERICADNAFWKKTFEGSDYLELAYEDFVQQRNVQLNIICDFLNVAPAREVESSLVKINPDAISEIVANYSQVVSALRETPYEWCLAG